jgi:hypothetical protein
MGIEEASYRWLNWHSGLDGEKGDGYILGSSNPESAISNIGYSTGGPLPEEVVAVIEKVWKDERKGVGESYYMPFSRVVATDP